MSSECSKEQANGTDPPDPLKSGYVFVDICGRSVSPSGVLSYLAKYMVGGKEVLLWERSGDLSPPAISAYERRLNGFQYTEGEKELLKKCAGSLKERSEQHRVRTTAGIFAIIMNCGIILSVFSLFGAESLSQVYIHLTEFYARHDRKLPKYFAYDDVSRAISLKLIEASFPSCLSHFGCCTACCVLRAAICESSPRTARTRTPSPRGSGSAPGNTW